MAGVDDKYVVEVLVKFPIPNKNDKRLSMVEWRSFVI